MTHNLFKIGQSLIVVVALLLFHIRAAAQTPELQLITEDQVFCDEVKNFDIKFLVNMPIAVDFYIDYTISANGVLLNTTHKSFEGSDLKEGENVKSDVLENITIVSADLSYDPQGRHVRYEYSFSLRYNTNYGEVRYPIDDILTIDLWKTPKAEIILPEKSDICGFVAEFKANTHWSDISTYKWETSDAFLELSNTTSNVCIGRLTSNAERSSEVVLYETTGGKCTTSDTHTINFKRLPEVTIAPTDGSEQFVCTALDNDPAFTFNGDLTTEGNGPFTIILSNGQQFINIPEATVTKEMTMKHPGNLIVTSVVDSDGCSANVNGMKGEITIIDRKPALEMPTDTIEFEGRDIYLTRKLSDMTELNAVGKYYETGFNWEVIDSYHHHGQWDNSDAQKVDKIIHNESYGLTSDGENTFFKFSTTKTGLITMQYTEWNIMDEHENCYNSVVQVISSYDVVNAPNGFSPNADFKNDYLVIEGIPDVNHLTVYDAKGKIIYEKENYRNNWNAEGVEDGYYIYVFEGEGIKTVKETLVIKRSKK